MLYFAYGSNMAPRQMASRCPGAQSIGAAVLGDWRFIMTARGSANIVREPGAQVYGVLWRCEPRHLTLLDRWEGVSWPNYRRRTVVVRFDGGAQSSAVTYISSRLYRGRARANYLLSAVIPGAQAHALPAGYLNELEAWRPRRPIAASAGRFSPRYIGRRR